LRINSQEVKVLHRSLYFALSLESLVACVAASVKWFSRDLQPSQTAFSF
jgi:hypothetical protein